MDDVERFTTLMLHGGFTHIRREVKVPYGARLSQCRVVVENYASILECYLPNVRDYSTEPSRGMLKAWVEDGWLNIVIHGSDVEHWGHITSIRLTFIHSPNSPHRYSLLELKE